MQTPVTATLDPGEKFQSGLSLLWSPAGQAAWDLMKKYHKVEAIELEPPTHLAEVLNHFKWDAAATLPENTFLYGGDDSEARRTEIREMLRKRIGANAAAMIGPFRPPGRVSEDAFRIRSALFVSCLTHSPHFPVGFVPKPNVFSFSNRRSLPVQGFGSDGAHAGSLGNALEILADDFKGTFVLKLPFYEEAKKRASFLTLVRMPNMTSLEKGIEQVQRALKAPIPADQAIKQNNRWWRYHHQLTVADRFWMPKLKAYLSCDYGELIGKQYLRQSTGPGTETYWQIREAQQLLSFRLDEQGAMTQAVFKISPDFLSSGGGGADATDAPKIETLPFLPRVFSFDGPFLAALWMKDAEWPYLACWVDSEEVMLKK